MPKRLKAVWFGDTGLKKTRTALAFPAPFVVDTEGGTDWYCEEFGLKAGQNVIHPTTRQEFLAAIEKMAAGGHKYRTFIIDSLTPIWEIYVSYWTDVFKVKKAGVPGNKGEFYELSPRDWGVIKEDWKRMLRALTALDMSVILTVREKDKYKDGALMVKEGVTFDAEKNLLYWPDVVLRFYRAKDAPMAMILKDRTYRLPKSDFPVEYKAFADAYKDLLTNGGAKVAIEPFVVPEPVSAPATVETATVPGPVLAAQVLGIQGPTDKQVDEFIKLVGPEGLNLLSDDLDKALARYGVRNFEDLDAKRADMVLSALRKAVSKKLGK